MTGNITIYVDGIQQATTGTPTWGSSTFTAETGTDHRIGLATSGSNPFAGNIDELSIWNKILNLSEITELYNAGIKTDLPSHSAYSNLLHWWRMGDGNVNIGVGSTITDQRGSANGTTTASTTFDIAS